MTRRAARVTHDEVCRVIKAAQTMGLSIGNIRFFGDHFDLVIKSGDSGEIAHAQTVQAPELEPLLTEPKL
jgi:hypothetical protein